MHTASVHRRNLVLVVVILTVLFSLTYYRHAAYRPISLSALEIQTPPSEEPVKPEAANHGNDRGITEIPKEPTACDAVDAHWLASDRTYWDGWASKAMFMNPDGSFTTENVHITTGEYVCVVVLLGPIPAVSAIRPEKHHAPADSITIYAQGERTRVPIVMEQHPKHGNVYLSSVKFTQPDTYYLESKTEYRSYFWEEPIYHPYRPFHYVSNHNLTVAANEETDTEKPATICDAKRLESGGSWIDAADWQQSSPADFYAMFGERADSHTRDDFAFIPNACRIDYKSHARVHQCLAGKTVHVWGDHHVQRNLEAFRSGDRWCREQQDEDLCNCQVPDAPWWSNTSIPLAMEQDITERVAGNINIHFNPFGTITLHDHRPDVKEHVTKLPRADIVVLSFGNDDIALNRMTPRQFEQSFSDLVGHFVENVYPDQTIIVRTPQYFCCGIIPSTSWNSGRSLAFANIIRQITQQFGDRVLLWDIHRLGLPGNTCPGSPDTKRDVIDTENALLWDLLCR